jgi:hypothetical protein
MNIPTIGGPRGIFEIFVPGVFLFLNFGLFSYLLPFVDQKTRDMVSEITNNSVLELVIAICFGYLIGILLRLLKTDQIDKLSSGWLMVFDKNARIAATQNKTKEKGKFIEWLKHIFNKGTPQDKKLKYKLYAIEEFPYIGWLEYVSKEYLPPEAAEFYKSVWAPRKRGNKQNKQFFNFCKLVVTSKDEKAASEIYAAEALTRYIAGMFYALMTASLIIALTFVFVGLESGHWMTGLLLIMLAYAIAMIIIVQRFRKMRIREVEVIFATSYKNRDLFERHDYEIKNV